MSGRESSWWIATELLAIGRARSALEPTRPHYNPKPAGVIRDGSATGAVLDWLRTRKADQWWTRGQIMAGTGRTEKSVNWALLYLRTQGRIECVPDGSRNPQYRRYRAVRQQGTK